MADRGALLKEAAQHKWFHAIDFGDCQSPGRLLRREIPQNLTLFGVMDMLSQIDVSGLDCLDIGTADGLIAFNMAMRGARRVVATDVTDRGRPAFHTARALLGVDVELVPDTSFEDIIDKLGEHRFDVVVCAGVMYHMLNPFDAILKARRLLKHNGLLLFQTRYDPRADGATLDFNPVSKNLEQLDVYWLPSRSAVTGMLALGAFQLLAVRTGTHNKFISTVARNVQLAEIVDAPGQILEQLERGIRVPEYCRKLPGEQSNARYLGPQTDEVIADLEFKPDFPPHPTEAKEAVGEMINRLG